MCGDTLPRTIHSQKHTHTENPMTKHKQTASLGQLKNYTTPPETPPEPLDTQAQIDALTHRVATLEGLLADVMLQLDKPYQNRHAKPHTETPKTAKPKQKPNPANRKEKPKPKPKPKPKQTQPAKDKTPSEADITAVTAYLQQHPGRCYHGKTLRTEIKENCEGLSNSRMNRVLKTLSKAGKLTIVENVEVDGEMLTGAYQYTP